MSLLQLIIRNLRFHWRSHLGIVLGTALASTVLTGALLVGDSSDHSLRQFAMLRLGQIHYAMATGNRFFCQNVSDRLQKDVQAHAAPVLRLRAVALAQNPVDSSVRQLHRVQVLGVDERFHHMSDNTGMQLTNEDVAISRKVANGLDLHLGDELSLRVALPSLLPRDAPLSSQKDRLSVRMRFRVKHIVSDSHLGRFSLEANQVAPNNVFVNIACLQEATQLKNKANMLLLTQNQTQTLSLEGITEALNRSWKLSDMGISVQTSPNGNVAQLESERVFLEPAVSSMTSNHTEAAATLTYLVNAIAKEKGQPAQRTPYSFVTACQPSSSGLTPVPIDMKDNEIVINRWLASHLSVQPGDTVTLTYLVLLPSGRFEERSRGFSVHSILEMDTMAREKDLMPGFPGLSDIESCKDWDVGMPMDEEALRDKPNEDYWNTYRDTPKAFVTLVAGQTMWANRFGNATAIRFSLKNTEEEMLRSQLQQALSPMQLGFRFIPVRQQALKAVSEALDLGDLFLGMSFFLVFSALMLVGLLFTFVLEQRVSEMGILRAIGLRSKHIRQVFLLEGAVNAGIGCLLGAVGAVWFTRMLLWGLAHFWQGAVAGAVIQYHADTGTFLAGAFGTMLAAALAMLAAMWKQTGMTVHALLSAKTLHERASVLDMKKGTLCGPWLALLFGLLSLGLVLKGLTDTSADPVMPFFGAGSLLLAAMLLFSRHVFTHIHKKQGAYRSLTMLSFGLRNILRRPTRSMTVTTLLACGSFLILSVSTMKQDMESSASNAWSGTGGFELFGESTIPLYEPIEKSLSTEQRSAIQSVAIKVRDGDDASCFNLNRAQTPRLLGVHPQDFSAGKAFLQPDNPEDLWSLLNEKLPDGSIPALVGDSDTLIWGLNKKAGKKQGDTLTYKDEFGQTFTIRLVAALPMRLSVFQGSLLIGDKYFTRLYPSEGGYRLFLFNTPPDNKSSVRKALQKQFHKAGMTVSTTTERLASFHTVENTYLNMFLVLGSMGLVLGSMGMGIVVLRNVLERRGELALLRAIGFSRTSLSLLIICEHALLLILGVGIGSIAAFLAMLPSLSAPGVQVPIALLSCILLLIIVVGLFCTTFATQLATRGQLLDSLSNE